VLTKKANWANDDIDEEACEGKTELPSARMASERRTISHVLAFF